MRRSGARFTGRNRLILGALAFAAVVLGGMAAARAAEGYHLLKKYPLGAAEAATREYFDYITVDSASRRVYLSHGTEIKVIDADNGNVVGTITGLKQDHGVAVARKGDYFRPEELEGDRRGQG